MARFIAVLALIAATWLVTAWFLMLTVGIVHINWIPELPTIGFKLAMLLAFLTVARALAGSVISEVIKVTGGND